MHPSKPAEDEELSTWKLTAGHPERVVQLRLALHTGHSGRQDADGALVLQGAQNHVFALYSAQLPDDCESLVQILREIIPSASRRGGSLTLPVVIQKVQSSSRIGGKCARHILV